MIDVLSQLKEVLEMTSLEVLPLCIGVLIIVLIIRSVYYNILMYFTRKEIMRRVTEENAYRAYKLLNAKLGVSINNHPKDWAKYRDMFYKINGSADVPSEIKEKIKKRLVKKGLYIDNMKIVDNYKGVSV